MRCLFLTKSRLYYNCHYMLQDMILDPVVSNLVPVQFCKLLKENVLYHTTFHQIKLYKFYWLSSGEDINTTSYLEEHMFYEHIELQSLCIFDSRLCLNAMNSNRLSLSHLPSMGIALEIKQLSNERFYRIRMNRLLLYWNQSIFE